MPSKQWVAKHSRSTGLNPRTGMPPGKAGRPRFEDYEGHENMPATKGAVKRHLNIEGASIMRKLYADGVLEEGMTIDQARIAYIHHLRNMITQGLVQIGGEDGDILDWKQEKAMHTRAQRERIEIELAEERGEMVRIAEIQPLLDEAAGNARVRLLGVPDLLAKEVAVMYDRPDEVRALMKNTLVEILNEFATALGQAASRARGRADDEDVPATAGSNGAGLGRPLPTPVKRGQRGARALAD